MDTRMENNSTILVCFSMRNLNLIYSQWTVDIYGVVLTYGIKINKIKNQFKIYDANLKSNLKF